jgi:hypothetical protein
MLCYQLSKLVPIDLLIKGSLVELGNQRPECRLRYPAWRGIWQGKDEAILHMCSGGNGFPETRGYGDPVLEAQFDLGVQQERRDQRANNVWATDLTQALADRKRGRCNG